MKTGTLKIALALAALWGPLATAETIVVDDQVQVAAHHDRAPGPWPDHGGGRSEIRRPADAP